MAKYLEREVKIGLWSTVVDKIIISYHKSPFGELVLGSFGEALCLCDWRYRKMRGAIDSRLQKGLNACFAEGESGVIESALVQLSDYFSYQRKSFDIPILPVGTDFQKQVWRALLEVPFGSTSTYRKLADKIGNPKAVRAVASANGANAISILIPCHRIIGSDGSLVGYAGGLKAKEKLLKLEHNLFTI